MNGEWSRICVLALAWLACTPVQAQTTVRYIHTDALGSVVAVTDENGNVVERREYEPYGAQLTPALQDGPGYTGHVQDAATGLVYMQQRYYWPEGGVFLSADPVSAYENGDIRHFARYAYAYNNPYRFTDPDGRCPQCLWGAPIGAGVSIAVQMGMAQGSFRERLGQVNWGQVGVATVAGAASGGVSAIASTATTTAGTIGANVVGNMAVGAVATQANATLVENRVASPSEVAQGTVASGVAAGAGAAIPAAARAAARASSAGMSQTERTATANLLDGIRNTTPDFRHTNTMQTSANAAGNVVGISDALTPLLDDKDK